MDIKAPLLVYKRPNNHERHSGTSSTTRQHFDIELSISRACLNAGVGTRRIPYKPTLEVEVYWKTTQSYQFYWSLYVTPLTQWPKPNCIFLCFIW